MGIAFDRSRHPLRAIVPLLPLILITGCGVAKDKPAAPSNSDTPLTATSEAPGESSPATADTPASSPPASKPLPPAKPATVSEAAAFIDLAKLTHIEPIGVSRREPTIVEYTGQSDPKTVTDIYRQQLTERGWSEVDENNGRYITDEYAATSFTKDGYWLNFSATPTGEPGTVMIRLANHGNVDTRQLPVVNDGEIIYGAQHTSIQVTADSVADTAGGVRELLRKDGWREFSPLPSGRVDTPEMAMLDFVKNGIVLSTYISIAPAQGGKTAVQFSTRMLARDLMLPPEYDSLELDERTSQFTCQSPLNVPALADHYRLALSDTGWEPLSDKPQITDQSASLGYRKDSNQLLRVDIKRSDEGQSLVSLETVTFTEPLADDSTSDTPADEPTVADEPAMTAGVAPRDIALPSGAEDVEIDAERQEIRFAVDDDVRVIAKTYLEQLVDQGWTHNKLISVTEDQFAMFNVEKDGVTLMVNVLGPIVGDRTTVTINGSELDWNAPPSDLADMPQLDFTEDSPLAQPDVDNPALVRSLDANSSSIKTITFTPDGSELWAGGWSIHAWQVEDGTPLDVPDLSDVYAIIYSPDGQQLVTAQGEGLIQVWDPADGELLEELAPDAGAVEGVAYAPDGKTLAATSEDGRLLRWNTANWQPLPDIAAHDGFFTCLAYAPNGKQFATARFTTKLWDAATGKLIRELSGDPAPAVGQLAYSPDSRLLAVAGLVPTVTLWDVESGKSLRTLRGHRESASSVAFSPDGRLIASGSWTKTVVVWDAASGEILRTLRGHTESISSVAFTPDGKLLATAGEEGVVRLWDVAVVLDDPASETNLHAPSPDEMPDEETGPIEPEFVHELPIPNDNSGYASEGTPFRRTITVTTNRGIEPLLDFYRTQLAERDWQETPDAAKLDDTSATTAFTSNGQILDLSLLHEFGETTIELMLRRPEAARQAGILAEPGQGRIILANSSDQPVEVTIAGQQLKLKVGEGQKEPNGPSITVKPGTCTATVRIGNKPPQDETFEVAPDQTWGLIILPEGALPVLTY